MNLLFLGDSITDCGHCFTSDNLGNGFVKETAKLLRQQSGETIRAVNGGTDGFTLPRIYQKWLSNYSKIPFDLAVILGGINEVGMAMEADWDDAGRRKYLENSGVALGKLLKGLAEDGCGRVLVLEPFLFQTPAFLQTWIPCLEDMRQVLQTTVKKQAAAAPGVRYLPTQKRLDQEAKRLGFSALTTDGVHLTPAGHSFLARLLMESICELSRPGLPFSGKCL